MRDVSSFSDPLAGSSGITVPHCSRYGLYCALGFVVWTVLFRFVFPFGDEPDFTVRAVELVEISPNQPWTPYYWVSDILDQLNIESFCEPDVSPVSVWGSLDSNVCKEPLEQIILRVAVTIWSCLPLLWIIVFRKAFQRTLDIFGFSVEANELNKRLDALATAIIIPGLIYYLGLLSHEQFSLTISLLISAVWGSWLLVLGLASYTMFLDRGNGVVVFAFLAAYIIIVQVWRLSGFKGLTILLTGTLGVAFALNYELLKLVQMVPILSDKAEAIFDKSLTSDFIEKYPKILRPGITYISAVFMTSAGIKAIPVQLIFGVASMVGLSRLIKGLRLARVRLPVDGVMSRQMRIKYEERLLPMIAALTTVVVFGLMLPDYANAKYYMFLAPFVVQPFVVLFSPRSRFIFMNSCCALVLICLAFQYN